MKYSKKILLILMGCCIYYCSLAQQTLVPKPYTLHIHYLDKDTSFNAVAVKLDTAFTNQLSCLQYINKIPSLLNAAGYPAASIDSSWFNSSGTHINLYLGKRYLWFSLVADSIEKKVLDESGFIEKNFHNKPISIGLLAPVQERILNYYERTGYPFAAIYLDSIRLEDEKMYALLKVKKGPLYHVDSIRVYGKAKINNKFLQHYLGISNNSIYNKDRLLQVSRRILDLPYLQEIQPSDITMLGSGSIVNLYLAPKKSSQVNFLIGFLPSSTETGKLQFTGDVNLNLKNALGSGETILLNWQQLQVKSPRLNLGYQQPYLFNSNFGVDFLFELFKKDSSYLQVNAQLGVQYLLGLNQSGKIFFQNQRTVLLASGTDTNNVRATKQLPANVDVSSGNFGVDYEWYNTNYRLNPKYGNEVRIIASAGLKKIEKNNDILNLKDPSFNYASLYDSVKLRTYQFRLKLAAAHYFQVAKQSTVKVGINAAVFSSQSVFRNELFQIGGYKLLRGFDEESIYATQYAVATVEYHYIVTLNSYLYGFSDIGYAKNKYQSVNVRNSFISGGAGLAFETKFGLLNISYAVGKRNDLPFNLRTGSKIHFGYVNYF
ncbi:MAG: hypothetical protein ABJA78_09325 [Ferruginibacter sp.]